MGVSLMIVEHPDALASRTIVHLLRWRAERQANHWAFSFTTGEGDQDIRTTYEALDRRARAVAAMLQREATAGDRALLLYPPGLEYVAAFLGCLYAGVVAVPVYPPKPRIERTLSRLRGIVRDARPAVSLTTSSVLPIAGQVSPQDDIFATTGWLATDTVGDAEAEAWREPAIDADTLAFLQYTSGSTTTPRGVMVSHGNLIHNEGLIQQAAALSEDSVGVSWLPLYHDMGLIGCVLQPLYTGFPCVLMSPIDFLQRPVRWLQTITRYRATASGAPNFAYDLCVNQITPQQRATLDLSSWQVALNGAEPVRPETLDRFATAFGPCGFRRESFLPCYGLAEATLLVTGGPAAMPAVQVQVDTSALRHGEVAVLPGPRTPGTSTLVSSGRVQPEQRALMVDPQTRVPCPPGRVGEIWVAGPCVGHGYWNAPEATEETFHARLAGSDDDTRFLRTGDLGFIHDGELFVTSRWKDLIVIRGCNHAPQDIERSVESSHPALRPGCGAAFSVDVDGDEQFVVVHEVARHHLDVDTDEVAAAIRRAVVDDHELEVHAVVLLRTGTLPRTSSGKVRRRACRDDFLHGGLQEVGRSVRSPRHPGDPVDAEASRAALAAVLGAKQEQRLPALVAYLRQRVAGAAGVEVAEICVDQPFLVLGLDSLRLLELKQRIEAELGIALPLERFIDCPTIVALGAAVLDEVEQGIEAVWSEIARLTDDEVDAQLAQLTAKGNVT
jgi:acyl-CoA synthetase (AMP-forming)/AMP-acid ligase II/acyl carrier protein